MQPPLKTNFFHKKPILVTKKAKKNEPIPILQPRTNRINFKRIEISKRIHIKQFYLIPRFGKNMYNLMSSMWKQFDSITLFHLQFAHTLNIRKNNVSHGHFKISHLFHIWDKQKINVTIQGDSVIEQFEKKGIIVDFAYSCLNEEMIQYVPGFENVDVHAFTTNVISNDSKPITRECLNELNVQIWPETIRSWQELNLRVYLKGMNLIQLVSNYVVNLTSHKTSKYQIERLKGFGKKTAEKIFDFNQVQYNNLSNIDKKKLVICDLINWGARLTRKTFDY